MYKFSYTPTFLNRHYLSRKNEIYKKKLLKNSYYELICSEGVKFVKPYDCSYDGACEPNYWTICSGEEIVFTYNAIEGYVDSIAEQWTDTHLQSIT